MTQVFVLEFIHGFNWFVFFFFIFWSGTYLVFTGLAFVFVRDYVRELRDMPLRKIFRAACYKPISVLVPSFQEAETIVGSVKTCLLLEYPEFEVIVINDGSEDDTMERLIEAYDLRPIPRPIEYVATCQPIHQVYVSRVHPTLKVVDKVHGGKPDTLNAGLAVAKYPLFCTIDADSYLDRDCLLKVVRPFMRDESTVAVGGTVRIVNGCRIEKGEIVEVEVPDSHLARFQVVEYLRAFLFGRVGMSALRCLLITSGAFSIYRKEAVLEVGGYRHDAVGEDMELICRLHRHFTAKREPYRITFVPDPVCWTEVPQTFGGLGRQRNRWQRGLIQALTWEMRMLFNPRYGTVGMLAMPFFVIFEMLGPIVETLGYVAFFAGWSLGVIDWPFAVLFLLVAFLLGFALSVSSLFLEEIAFRRYPSWAHMALLLGYGVLENFGYRQLTIYWRLKGTLDYMLGRMSWEQQRGRQARMGSSFGAD